MKTSLIDCRIDIEIADYLESYLRNRGVGFNSAFFPIMQEEWFLPTAPEHIVPFSGRRRFPAGRSAICFYSNDDKLYTRARNLEKDLSTYKKFLGVMPFDFTVTRFADRSHQLFHLRLNALCNAFFGVNGIKFAAPTRWGGLQNVPYFFPYRHAPILSVGTVGTLRNSRESREIENMIRAVYLTFSDPKLVLSYGKMHPDELAAWQNAGVEVKQYPDFNSLARGRVYE